MKTITTLAILASFNAPHAHRPLVYGPRNAPARVILLHGLDGTPQTMLTQPYVQLVRMLARRYQVIIPDEPFDLATVQANGAQAWFGHYGTGSGYRIMWLQQFRRVVAWADRRYGQKRLMVAGISWGGMHAMLAACYDHDVAAYAVSSPVVDPDQLTEFSTDALTALNPNLNGCAPRLNALPGFVGWGDADTRVGDAPVESFLAADRRVRSCRYHDLGHTSDTLTETNMVRALTGRRPDGCWA